MKKYTKEVLCVLSLLLLVPSCAGKRKKAQEPQADKKVVQREVDVPVSFFEDDADVQEFSLLDDEDVALMQEAAQHNAVLQQVDATGTVSEFKWTQESQDAAFKPVYFAFDGYGIRDDQKDTVAFDIELIKQKIAESSDHTVTVVVDGHACHSAGTPAYNLAISERRAGAIRDYLVAQGVPAENIKIVGRGHEAPAFIDGKKVTGDRQEQWPNRRGEIHIIYA